MNNETCILGTLRDVCNQNVNHSKLNQLIELTQSFAFTFLKFRYKNLNRVLLGEDITYEEMAIDAIAPLFERDDSGTLVRIKKAFLKWNPKIETEEQAYFFINSIVAKSTEKYVADLLRDSDPFFSKILDSLNYLVEKQGYIKKQILGTTYIIENKIIKLGTLPSTQFVYELPLSLFANPQKMLKDIFTYINDNSDNTAAIPLNALTIKLKKIRSFNFEMNELIGFNSEVEIETVISNAIEVAYNKLEDSYLMKNKIDEVESRAIKKALYNISKDLRDGGINPGLHKYLIEEFPSLRFSDYRMKYQYIFEYLFKVLKKEIIRQL